VIEFSIVRTVRKNLNMIGPKNKVALEAWLAELHRILAVSGMGPAFLALQITELENKCAVLRKRMHHKAKPNSRVRKRCALRSAA
jgi:pyrroline-5-carboxylate reductase